MQVGKSWWKVRPLMVLLALLFATPFIILLLYLSNREAFHLWSESIAFYPTWPKNFRIGLGQYAILSTELTSDDYNNRDTVEIGGTELTNIRPVTKFKNLKHLSLNSPKISNIKPLAKLNKLQTLNISYIETPVIYPPKYYLIIRAFLKLPINNTS